MQVFTKGRVIGAVLGVGMIAAINNGLLGSQAKQLVNGDSGGFF